MVWSVENSKNDEASKIRWELVPYMNGRVLDIGCGAYKCFPHFVGVDNGHHWGGRGVDVMVETAEKLELFASGSCDAVFSSHLLEHIEHEKVADTLKEWARVTKQGGYICLYLPDEDSLFFVFQITQKRTHEFSFRSPKPAKTCAVVRYGAQGDMAQITSLFPWLKAQGYHITLYCQPNLGYEVEREVVAL